MLYLVSYDIESDALRLATAKQLLALGLERVQRSVFIGPLKPEAHRALTDWLTRSLPESEGIHCMVLPLTEYTVHQAFCRTYPAFDWPYLSGETHTLIF